MVQFVLTKEVNHILNDNYACLLVQFGDDDKNYHHKKMNWMPRDQEVIDLVRIMRTISPTFREKLKEV